MSAQCNFFLSLRTWCLQNVTLQILLHSPKCLYTGLFSWTNLRNTFSGYIVYSWRLVNKQNRYPVLLLTSGTNNKYEEYLDPRTKTIPDAIWFGNMVGLFGKRSSILLYIYTDPFLAKNFIHLFKKNLFNQILKLNMYSSNFISRYICDGWGCDQWTLSGTEGQRQCKFSKCFFNNINKIKF